MNTNTSNPFGGIANLIKKLNEYDDAIIFDNKIKNLTQDFLAIILENDCTLKEALEYFNTEALNDSDFGEKFALLFSSNVFNNLVNATKFRREIMILLQANHSNANQYKNENLKQFYNSINLLGECYYRYRIAGKPITVLGEALFQQLIDEIQIEIKTCQMDASHIIDWKFVKLILTQVVMNGTMAQENNTIEIQNLLLEIRRCLIEVSNLTSHIKALLLMILDVHHNHYKCSISQLDTFYEPFMPDVKEEPSTVEETMAKKQTTNGTTNEMEEKRHTLMDAMKESGHNNVQQAPKVIAEHIGKPLKASERLKVVQRTLAVTVVPNDEADLADSINAFTIKTPSSKNSTTEKQSTADVNCVREKENIQKSPPSQGSNKNDIFDITADWYEEGQSYLKPMNTTLQGSVSCHEINSQFNDDSNDGTDVLLVGRMYSDKMTSTHQNNTKTYKDDQNSHLQTGSRQQQSPPSQAGRRIRGRNFAGNRSTGSPTFRINSNSSASQQQQQQHHQQSYPQQHHYSHSTNDVRQRSSINTNTNYNNNNNHSNNNKKFDANRRLNNFRRNRQHSISSSTHQVESGEYYD